MKVTTHHSVLLGHANGAFSPLAKENLDTLRYCTELLFSWQTFAL